MGREMKKQVALSLDTSGDTPKFLPPNLPTEPIRDGTPANLIKTAAGAANETLASITIPNGLAAAVTRLVYGAGNNGALFPAAGLQVDFERVLNGVPTVIESKVVPSQGPFIEHGSIQDPLLTINGGAEASADVVLFRIVFRNTAQNPVPAGIRVFGAIEAHRIQPRTALVSGL